MSQAHTDTKKRKQPGQRLGGGQGLVTLGKAAGCGQRGGQEVRVVAERVGVLSLGQRETIRCCVVTGPLCSLLAPTGQALLIQGGGPAPLGSSARGLGRVATKMGM